MNNNQIKNFSFMQIFLIGFIVAFIMAFLFACIALPNISIDSVCNFAVSLIASLMTLLAAIIARHAIQQQIKQAQNLKMIRNS